jgi:hypothetical protein
VGAFRKSNKRGKYAEQAFDLPLEEIIVERVEEEEE